MLNQISHQKKKIWLYSLLISFSIFGLFVGFHNVSANGRGICVGYFYGEDFCDTGHKVIKDGLSLDMSSQAAAKADLISTIKSMNNSDSTTPRLAGAYIIQTMRGPDANGNWDHHIKANDDDVADWELKVNNPDIVIKEEEYSANINTRMDPGGGWDDKDIATYNGDGEFDSYVFYKGTTARYVIKKACGNPLGNLEGLPTIVLPSWHLTPSMATTTPEIIESGNSIQLNLFVDKDGDPNPKDGTWILTRRTTTGESGEISSAASFANGTNTLSPYNEVANYPVGTRICFILYAEPAAHDNAGRASSAEKCFKIGKKPKVQIWGSDLLVGRAFSGGVAPAKVQTSTSNNNGTMFGSWVEYAIFATGTIRGTASSSAFATGLSSGDYSRLSFSNSGSKILADETTCAAPGCYGLSGFIPDVAANFPIIDGITPSITSTSSIDLSTIANNIVYTATDNLKISGNIPKGKWIVINAPTANVIIENNITYNASDEELKTIQDIPQLVIIANNITINNNVTNVDAWLIAKGTSGEIKTCTGEAITASECNKTLIFNGPVMAKKLYLWRTAGSNVDSPGAPAEIINLRADAYLWAKSRSLNESRIRTVYTTELPPRL
ncbi:MAG: hypothetical protein WCK26_00450 [Candidatus Saccharibacteria bacterium]